MNKENIALIGKKFLQVVLFLLLAVVLFALGLMVGYAVVGDGEKALSILSLDKWQDLISKFTGK